MNAYDNAGPFSTPFPRSQVMAYTGDPLYSMSIQPPVPKNQGQRAPVYTKPDNFRGAYHIPATLNSDVIVSPFPGRFSQPKYPGFPLPIMAFTNPLTLAPKIYQQ